jgi:hypothetical protein
LIDDTNDVAYGLFVENCAPRENLMKSIVLVPIFAAALIVAGVAPAAAENLVIGSYYAGLCMQGAGAVTTAQCNGGGGQVFQFSGYGPISQGGRCLQGTGRGNPVTLQPCNNTADQKWAFNGQQLNNEGGWCADIERESKSPGARVIAYNCKNSVNQHWRKGVIVSGPQVGLSASATTALQRRPPQPGSVVDMRTGNIIAAGGGNVIAQGGGNIIAAGGGNFIQFR